MNEQMTTTAGVEEEQAPDCLVCYEGAGGQCGSIAHAEGMMWLVEVLEQERQSLAAQAACLLKNSEPWEVGAN